MDRKDPRHRVDREVVLIFDGHTMHAQIRDSSLSGARIAVAGSEWLPPQFVLDDAGVRRRVALVWQGTGQIGIRYLDQPPRKRVAQFGRRGR